MAEKSLKDSNRRPLYAVMALNVLFYIFVAEHDEIGRADWHSLARQSLEFLPNALVGAFLTILNGVIPANAKASIVYGRVQHPLPSARAFSYWINRDPNIDPYRLREKLGGELPSNPEAQTRAWYGFYKAFDSEPSVRTNHGYFLFARDLSVLLLMFGLVSLLAAALQFSSGMDWALFVGVWLLELGFSVVAARNYGNRMVTTVLALASAKRD